MRYNTIGTHAHFHDVTDDKMKIILVNILQEHMWISLKSVYL